MNLKDKVIVVTGSGQGLGRAISVGLAEKGARLALVDLNQDKLDETLQLCHDAGGEGKTYIASVAVEDEVTAVFGQIISDFGSLDGLVNNAAILRDGMLLKVKDGAIVKRMSLAEWQAVIDVNLTGAFLCGREAATKMVELGKPGVIINLSSISRAGNMGQSNYSATKSGVATLAVTWGRELARYGIRTAAIAPGVMGTEMVASMKPEALARMTAGIPLGRVGEPSEVAQTAVFIFENEYITGRVLEVDGGLRW